MGFLQVDKDDIGRDNVNVDFICCFLLEWAILLGFNLVYKIFIEFVFRYQIIWWIVLRILAEV